MFEEKKGAKYRANDAYSGGHRPPLHLCHCDIYRFNPAVNAAV